MSMLAGRTPGLDSASQSTSVVADSMASYIDRLEAIVAEVIATWRGGADQAFKDKHTEWRAAGDDCVRKLREQSVALQKGSGEYNNTNLEAIGLMRATQPGGGAAPFGGNLGGPVAD
ncbi:WXG100 family type VII secretion target [Plantactinospora sp. ZYX-F-223]|uniref:WXG100 family type VII secretion target n=1 Tax=Plantactinospora sp. ZYX-F-223 TaxID=3144103 RepID=UPI0031FBD758